MKLTLKIPNRIQENDLEDIWFAWYPVVEKRNNGYGLVYTLLWLEKVRRIRNAYYKTKHYYKLRWKNLLK